MGNGVQNVTIDAIGRHCRHQGIINGFFGGLYRAGKQFIEGGGSGIRWPLDQHANIDLRPGIDWNMVASSEGRDNFAAHIPGR